MARDPAPIAVWVWTQQKPRRLTAQKAGAHWQHLGAQRLMHVVLSKLGHWVRVLEELVQADRCWVLALVCRHFRPPEPRQRLARQVRVVLQCGHPTEES